MNDHPSFGRLASTRYGEGVTRRRIRLTGEPGTVFAELEDHAHAMRLRLHHRDGRIVAIEPDFHRYPLIACTGAAEPLEALVGEPVGQDARTFFGGGRARRNCTHMFDLAWLASRHALRGDGQRLYAVDIPDMSDDRMEIAVRCDGADLFSLVVEDGMIQSPLPFAGRHLFRGFASWLGETDALGETEIEAAMIVQKVVLIQPARRYRLPAGPVGAAEKRAIAGACYSYAPERIDHAERRADVLRDFSDRPEDLLKFL
ncbi:DUF2889 domain-containing protein [Flavisphingomonas formosensis]|uniref:DUF2889 domain-containing protein n=1 Tax=Flavisphingomonas formosensis TaxID=861534 RepID=UPI0012FC0FF6|nr:DUF2889 domain-containing protein [Sphingomonas formosensis]